MSSQCGGLHCKYLVGIRYFRPAYRNSSAIEYGDPSAAIFERPRTFSSANRFTEVSSTTSSSGSLRPVEVSRDFNLSAEERLMVLSAWIAFTLRSNVRDMSTIFGSGTNVAELS